MNSAQFIIYGLSDPTGDELRYVGKSVSGLTRARAHTFPSQLRGNNRRINWVKSLLARGLRPEVQILDEVANADTLPILEKQAIAFYREMGCDLVNGTDGGEGAVGRKLSEEARKKISAAQKARVRTDDERQRISFSQKERCRENPPDTSHLTKALSERDPEVAAEAHRRAAAATAESNRNRVWSAESRKKLSETKKRNGILPPNPSTFSAETRAKMSASAKARCARSRLKKVEA